MPLAFYPSLGHVISFKGFWNISISGLHVILYPITTGIASKSLFCHVIMWDSPFKPAGCNLGHALSFLSISLSCYLVQRLLRYLYFQITCYFIAHNHCIKNINLEATLFFLRWDNPNPWGIPMGLPTHMEPSHTHQIYPYPHSGYGYMVGMGQGMTTDTPGYIHADA